MQPKTEFCREKEWLDIPALSSENGSKTPLPPFCHTKGLEDLRLSAVMHRRNSGLALRLSQEAGDGRKRGVAVLPGLGVDEEEIEKRVRGGGQIHRLKSRARKGGSSRKRSLCPQST